ncbi:MAG: CobW family GTP-binding protein [Clostridia bacterium]|nr:CobW family GTP-binding protein [Clostridia bacterium]
MTKIDIFSGFLGAGKTTLIKKLIKEAYVGEKLVLIENEFGTIGIDGAFLKDSGIKINELNSGCICCSLVGDFSKALKQVLEEYNPDRIIIEPSGVGKLSDVTRAVESVDADIKINGLTTIADANKCKMYMKNFGEFFNDQIENAGCIVLSHTDNINDEKLQGVIDMIKEHNSSAVIISTSWDKLDGKEILAAVERKDTLEEALKNLSKEQCPVCGHHHDHDEHHHHDDEEHHHHHNHEDEHHHEEEGHCHHEHHHDHDDECGCHHDHEGHHHADEIFTSWGMETARKYSKEEILNILNSLSDEKEYGTVLRAKGIVASEDSWIHFDYVPGEPDVRFGSAAVCGRLCVIGSGIDEDKLKSLFNC